MVDNVRYFISKKQLIFLITVSLITLILSGYYSATLIQSNSRVHYTYSTLTELGNFNQSMSTIKNNLTQSLRLAIAEKDLAIEAKYETASQNFINDLNNYLKNTKNSSLSQSILELERQFIKLDNINDDIIRNISNSEFELASQRLNSPEYIRALASFTQSVEVFQSISEIEKNNIRNAELSRKNLTMTTSVTSNFVFIVLLLFWSHLYFNKSQSARQEKSRINEQNEERFKQLARYDPLTGLPNRFLFQESLKLAMASAKKTKYKVALLYVDLDNFKNVNDTLGHDSGDLLLQVATKRITSSCRPNDIIARLGGDEFAIILDDVKDTAEVSTIASRIIKNLKLPFKLNGNTAHTSTSIGVAIYYPEKNVTLKQLVQYADLAMYKSKQEGKDCFRFYTKQLNEEVNRRVQIEEKLRSAIEKNELQLYYQPQVDSRNHKIVGLEALIRWENDELGFVSPAEFIPVAEESNLIIDIGDWIMATALKQFAEWSEINPEITADLRVSINVSTIQMCQVNFTDKIMALVKQSGLSTKHFMLEITETALIKKPELAKAALNKLHDAGFLVSVDDFGTGFSSLTLLQDFPIDEIKIDYTFTKQIVSDKESAKLVQAIINLSNTLNIDVIAEGVETKEQIDYLMTYGCHHVQGWYYSKARASDEIVKMIKQGKARLRTQNQIEGASSTEHLCAFSE